MKFRLNDFFKQYPLTIIFLIVIVAITSSKIFSYDLFHYVIWGDRDISRSVQLSESFLVSGSELQDKDGVRVPGGAIHYLNYLLTRIHASPLMPYLTMLVLTIVSTVLLFDIGRRTEGILAGTAAVLVFLSSNFFLTITNRFYNPLYGMPFTIVAFYFLSRFVLERRERFLFWSVVFIVLSAQMQMAVVFILLLLIIYLFFDRIPVSRSTLLGILGVVILLYAPWIVHKIFGVFESNSMVPQVSLQVLPSIGDEDISGVIRKFLLVVLNNVSLGEPSIFRTAFPVGAFLLGISGLAFAPWNMKGAGPGSRTVRRYMIFLIFIITAVALLAHLTTQALGVGFSKARYFGFLTPAIALLSGIGFGALCRLAAVQDRSYFVKTILLGVVGILVLRGAFLTYSEFRRSDLRLAVGSNYSDFLSVAKDINRTFGFDSDAIKRRAAFLIKDNGVWTARVTPINYILDYLDLRTMGRRYDGCVFVVARRPFSGPAEISRGDAKQGVKSLPYHKNSGMLDVDRSRVAIDVVERRDKYFLIGARLPLGGCPKSYMNPYIPTVEDRYLESRMGRRNGPAQLLEEKQGSSRFMLRHGAAGERFPLYLMIDLRRVGSRTVQATVFSNQLRNSEAQLGGYWKQSEIERPTLIFKRIGQEEEFRYVLFPGVLGKGVYVTPWPARAFELPAGQYRLSLTFKLVHQARYLLADRFVVGR